ncbi:MAG: hypothetical protein CVU12_09700 [Bacteroidetes bacterium HGW-Bacteroidetes-7]|nr:MAG: hypothetical protein CVU12_09700 [Bacteroidetes bacterium HGW-Bacteroidetes-7]
MLFFVLMMHNLFIAVQKLRLAPEIWLANQTFVGVYFYYKSKSSVGFLMFFKPAILTCVYILREDELRSCVSDNAA